MGEQLFTDTEKTDMANYWVISPFADKMQVSRNETDELIYLYQSGMKNIAFRKEEILSYSRPWI